MGALKGLEGVFHTGNPDPRDAPGCGATTLCVTLRGAPVLPPDVSWGAPRAGFAGRALWEHQLGGLAAWMGSRLSPCPFPWISSSCLARVCCRGWLAAEGSIPVGMRIHRDRPLLQGWMWLPASQGLSEPPKNPVGQAWALGQGRICALGWGMRCHRDLGGSRCHRGGRGWPRGRQTSARSFQAPFRTCSCPRWPLVDK